MPHLNIEIKARTRRAADIRDLLLERDADFRGLDRQRDTYFNSLKGRMKLREGRVENSLIYYDRPDLAGPKPSVVHLCPLPAGLNLREVLAAAYGIWKTVRKDREIYFIENVKFHLDRVEGLGEFVEIEAIDADGSRGEARLREQCAYYMELFGIEEADLITQSYSDMIG